MNCNCVVQVYAAVLYIVDNKYHIAYWQDMIYFAKGVIHLFNQ